MEGLSGHANNAGTVLNPPQQWRCFGSRCPRQEIVFFAQALLVYMVVIASIVNLSCTDVNMSLWVALLSSSIGIMLPSPSVKNPFKRHGVGDGSRARYVPDVGIDTTP